MLNSSTSDSHYRFLVNGSNQKKLLIKKHIYNFKTMMAHVTLILVLLLDNYFQRFYFSIPVSTFMFLNNVFVLLFLDWF